MPIIIILITLILRVKDSNIPTAPMFINVLLRKSDSKLYVASRSQKKDVCLYIYIYIYMCVCVCVCVCVCIRASLVGITTRYALSGPGDRLPFGRDFTYHTLPPPRGPALCPRVCGLFLGGKVVWAWL